MEFVGSSGAPIIPDPEHAISADQLSNTQAAVDFFGANAERVQYFKGRASELGRTGEDTVVTVIDVDDPMGGVLAEALMPGHDWQRFRDAGEAPVARGLASKEGVVGFLQAAGFTTAAAELEKSHELMVTVIHSGVALVLDVEIDTTVKGPDEKVESNLEGSSELDMQAVINSILPRGHAIHGYSSASNERVIKILPTNKYSDEAPLLGFGVDSDAELALARALATYVQRESDGLEFMEASQYPHLTEGWNGSMGHASKFDNIVWGGHIILFQEGNEVVAKSQYGGDWGMSPFEVRGESALEAIERLTSEYVFFSSLKEIRDNLSSLPGLTWLLKKRFDLKQLEDGS